MPNLKLRKENKLNVYPYFVILERNQREFKVKKSKNIIQIDLFIQNKAVNVIFFIEIFQRKNCPNKKAHYQNPHTNVKRSNICGMSYIIRLKMIN